VRDDVKRSTELAQQVTDHALLVRAERRERRGGDLGSNLYRLLGYFAAALGQRHRAAAVIVRIVKRRDEAARPQTVEAVPAICQAARDRGLALVRFDDLVGA